MSTPAKPTAQPTAQPTAFRFAAPRAKNLGVDRNAGTLSGIALLTAGLEAKGHGIWIDEKTLATAAAVLAEKSGDMKAAISHLSWSEFWDGETDRVMEFPGWFSGCTVVGSQLVAAKLQFYDDFKSDQQRLFNRILEMAEKTPHLFGISLEPYGYLVYVGEDGVEYSEKPKDIALKYDGTPALRVTDLTYGAIVDDPAANPGGFFAQLSRELGESKLGALLKRVFAGELAAEQPTAAKPAAGVAGKTGPVGVVGQPLSAAAKPAAPALVNSGATTEPAPLAMKNILDYINATFSADKAKHAQALSIFAAKPEITVEALAAEMQKLDLAAAQAQVTTLTADKAKLKSDLEAAEKARDEWKGKFEAIKNSGQAAPVELGAESAGAAAVTENPWAEGSINLTRQAEIELNQPKLAAQLREAAKKPAAKKA